MNDCKRDKELNKTAHLRQLYEAFSCIDQPYRSDVGAVQLPYRNLIG